MRIIYAQQPFPSFQDEELIFLVGPTPRSPDVPSWRPNALGIIEQHDFDGLVFAPEPKDGKWKGNYLKQIAWEREALDACSEFGSIAAWVPRDLETMPAFTTNVEFGFYVGSERLWYGRPPAAPNTRYLDQMYRDVTKREPCNTLEELIILAIKNVKIEF